MRSPINIDERDDMLAAEYALGTMPHGERVAFEQRLAGDKQLQARVAWWDQQFVPMADAVAPVRPPASVLNNIEARLFSSNGVKQSWWNSVGFWRGLSIASIAGMLVLGALWANIASNLRLQEAEIYVAQLAGETSNVKIAALYNADNNTLRVTRIAGKSATNRDYQLWAIADGSPPVSLGVLPVEDNFEIAVPASLHATLASGAVLAISDEPKGGSPTGLPTGAVLATGQILPI